MAAQGRCEQMDGNESGEDSPGAGAATEPLRILAVSALWQGANDYAFVRAFRRAGHSVQVVSEAEISPKWQSKSLRAVRRLLHGPIVKEFNRILLETAKDLRPHLVFVFKGPLVTAETLRELGKLGCVRIQFYPDVSFRTHGTRLPEALKAYDWIFTAKTFGLTDMSEQLGIRNASFLPHGFDPETHRPHVLTAEDERRYGCDFSFIGNWSRKKQSIMEQVCSRLPTISCRIWGPREWGVLPQYQHQHVLGIEYAKAIALSRINIALLSEQRAGASSGDLITARTFEIPACGGFMLHERTDEARQFFRDEECAYFSDVDELVEKISYYLANEGERREIAAAGMKRCLTSGYSSTDQATAVLDKYDQIRQL